MIKINKNIKNEYENGKINDLFNEIDAVLSKRSELQDRYLRGVDSSTIGSSDTLQIYFEKFITDLAAGYLSGEISYNMEIVDESEQPAYRLLHPNGTALDPDTAAQLKYILTDIDAKNHCQQELKQLFHDAVLFGACYERQLDVATPTASAASVTHSSSSDPNYTYYALSALNTVALFSTDIEDQAKQSPVAIVSAYTLDSRNAEDSQEHTLYYCIECNPYTDTYQTSIYDKTTGEDATSQYGSIVTLREEKPSTHHITTFSVYEPDPSVSIIDPIISLISAYEDIMKNLNNMYQYNDTDAKLKISGYVPENTLTITNPDYDPSQTISSSNPQVISNPARQIEDQYLAESKTFFVQEGGDVSWLLKEINAEDTTTYLKYYVDLIFQISGIPNTNDDAFNSGDLNASAIDRKFYTMALMLDDIRQGVKTLITRRWGNFLTRINLINGTSFDVSDVNITIGTNLPSMTDETINQQLALNGILSQKTLLSNLGYDYATEQKNKEQERYDNNILPDTVYVTPSSTTESSSEDSSSTAGTQNQVGYKTEQAVTNATTQSVPDKTDNIHTTQTREGRPNK